MTNKSKNPMFWGLVAVVVGAALGVWGLIKNECIGPNCWVGSGFLMWSGGLLIVTGLAGWQIFGNRK